MTITLKPEWQKYVEEQVRSGRFASAEELLAAALTRFRQDETFGEFAPGELDAMIDEAEAQFARGKGVDLDVVFDEIRAMSEAQRRREAGEGRP